LTGSDTWQKEMKCSFPGPQRLRTLLLYLLVTSFVDVNHLVGSFVQMK